MSIIAWTVIVVCALDVIGGPFLIGQPRKPYTAITYLVQLLICTLLVALSGRILGWW